MEGQGQVQAVPKVPLPPGLCGWMAFIAIWTIIGGAFNCLSVIGLIWGVMMIVAGVALWSGKDMLLAMGGVDPAYLPFLEKLKTFMMLTGIVYILSVVLGILIFIVFVGFGLAFADF
jgi:hypothetical protein